MVVVVTGSTRGIGFGLAKAFLERGCSVMISGRTRESADAAVARLAASATPSKVVGKACDVSDAADVQALWDETVRAFGRVDHWINNAGICNRIRPFIELSPDEIAAVVDTNMKGTMQGSLIAAREMVKQGHGQLFNMEGWGSRGEMSPGMAPYSSTKRGLRFFTDALARELKDTRVRVGTLSPGMVVTDSLVTSYDEGLPENWRRMRWIFHFVVDPPEVVCAWLADKVLSNDRNGVHHRWMTPWRLAVRFVQPSYWRRNPFAGSKLDTLGR